MTLILDMASGTEYLGEELSSPKQRPAQTAQPATAKHSECAQLRLEMVQVGACEQRPAAVSPGLDLEALIQSLED